MRDASQQTETLHLGNWLTRPQKTLVSSVVPYNDGTAWRLEAGGGGAPAESSSIRR